MRRPAADRYWDKVSKLTTGKVTNGEYCWVWTGGVNKDGYGLFNRGTRPSLCVLAHRYGYEIHAGRNPGKTCVLHHCDVPACVNPVHLFAGTRADNAADKVRKGRQRGPRGEHHPKAKLTPDEVRAIRHEYDSGLCRNVSELHRRHKIGRTALRYLVGRKTWKGPEYEPRPGHGVDSGGLSNPVRPQGTEVEAATG